MFHFLIYPIDVCSLSLPRIYWLPENIFSVPKRNMKELIGFFINNVFVGVFQYDFGPPKHALELRDYVKYMFSPCIFTLHLMISIDPVSSIATLKYGHVANFVANFLLVPFLVLGIRYNDI